MQARTAEENIKAQVAAQRRQIASQEKMEKAKLDLEEKRIILEEKYRSSQEARTEHDHNLAMLDRDMRNAASSLEKLADPAQYDTPSAYRAALYDKATPEQRRFFDNSEFTNVLDLYHAANASAKNTAANTEHTKTDTERLNESIKILKNDVYVSDMTHMSETDRINSENALRQIIADAGYELESLKYDYLTSEEGKQRQERIESAKKFWELAETRYGIPVKVLIQVARLIGAVYVGKGMGSSSANTGSIVRQSGYEFIYSN